MTPFALIQRAARLAPELDKMLGEGMSQDGEFVWTTERVLRALHRAGLTLEADVDSPGTVAAACQRLGVNPTGP